MRYLFAALCAAFLAAPVSAQWGARSGAVAPSAWTQRQLSNWKTIDLHPAKLEWVKDRSAPGQIDLVRDGWKLVGAYDPETGIYQRLIDFDKQQWSEPEALPDGVPLPPGGVLEQVSENFGVDLEKLHQEEEGYKFGEQAISKEKAYDLAQNGLPDDNGKLWLTVTGPEADCKRFEDAWHAKAPSAIKDKVLMSVVPTDHFWLRRDGAKFKNDGKPTIYVQAPNGESLWRQDDDTNAVANVEQAVRDYDPKRDKTPNSPLTPTMPDLSQIPTAVWVIGGVLLFAFFSRRKETS